MTALAISRRTLTTGMAAALATGLAGAPLRPAPAVAASALGQRLAPLWEAWKASHLRPEGRVVDTFQDGASHSEGQGYAMVLAEAMGDAETFAALWRWTREHLAVREADALLAWRWFPDADAHVPDLNNASDGDLFCAWALLRAARRLGESGYADDSRALAGAIAGVCLREVGAPGAAARVLLPGADGFERDDHLVLNPSYAMPRALEALADAHGIPALAQAATSARRMNDRLSASSLPPDWVGLYDGRLGPAEGWNDVYGYEALRIPLFEIWSGRPEAPAVRAASRLYAATADPAGSVVTRATRSTGRVLERSPDAGYGALTALVACADPSPARAVFPAFVPQQSYYPATLHLMSLVASHEAQLEC